MGPTCTPQAPQLLKLSGTASLTSLTLTVTAAAPRSQRALLRASHPDDMRGGGWVSDRSHHQCMRVHSELSWRANLAKAPPCVRYDTLS